VAGLKPFVQDEAVFPGINAGLSQEAGASGYKSFRPSRIALPGWLGRQALRTIASNRRASSRAIDFFCPRIMRITRILLRWGLATVANWGWMWCGDGLGMDFKENDSLCSSQVLTTSAHRLTLEEDYVG